MLAAVHQPIAQCKIFVASGPPRTSSLAKCGKRKSVVFEDENDTLTKENLVKRFKVAADVTSSSAKRALPPDAAQPSIDLIAAVVGPNATMEAFRLKMETTVGQFFQLGKVMKLFEAGFEKIQLKHHITSEDTKTFVSVTGKDGKPNLARDVGKFLLDWTSHIEGSVSIANVLAWARKLFMNQYNIFDVMNFVKATLKDHKNKQMVAEVRNEVTKTAELPAHEARSEVIEHHPEMVQEGVQIDKNVCDFAEVTPKILEPVDVATEATILKAGPYDDVGELLDQYPDVKYGTLSEFELMMRLTVRFFMVFGELDEWLSAWSYLA